jgi:uncharacterized phiE125 gp8 family phage protein
MAWSLTEVTAPSTEPLSTAEAKLHLRVDIDDDDTIIARLITAARRKVEQYTRHALITQTWRMNMSGWPEDGDAFKVPLPPLQSVSSIKYKDTDGDESTWDSGEYIVDTDPTPGKVVLAHGESWPSTALYPTSPIAVTFVAGFGDASTDVPEDILAAMLLLIGHLYENREATVGVGNIQVLPLGVQSLLWDYRAKAMAF